MVSMIGLEKTVMWHFEGQKIIIHKLVHFKS